MATTKVQQGEMPEDEWKAAIVKYYEDIRVCITGPQVDTIYQLQKSEGFLRFHKL